MPSIVPKYLPCRSLLATYRQRQGRLQTFSGHHFSSFARHQRPTLHHPAFVRSYPNDWADATGRYSRDALMHSTICSSVSGMLIITYSMASTSRRCFHAPCRPRSSRIHTALTLGYDSILAASAMHQSSRQILRPSEYDWQPAL